MGRKRTIEHDPDEPVGVLAAVPDVDGDDEGQAVDDVREDLIRRLLESAGTLDGARAHLEREVRTRVMLARSLGATWAAIGRTLGVGRSTALRRYRAEDLDAGLRFADGQQLLMPDADDLVAEAELERRGL